MALVAAKDVKREVQRCKKGVSGDFRITAYVETEEGEGEAHPGKPGKGTPGKHGKKGNKELGGRFKAIGVAAPNKEGAEKVDCIVDALRPLELPSPGSYAAKVSFTL
jgi:hypothetical protein